MFSAWLSKSPFSLFFKGIIFKITWLGYHMIMKTLFYRERELRLAKWLATFWCEIPSDTHMCKCIVTHVHTRARAHTHTHTHTHTHKHIISMRCDNNGLVAWGGIQSQLSLLQFKSSFSWLLIGCERDRREPWFVPALPLIWGEEDEGLCVYVCVCVLKQFM